MKKFRIKEWKNKNEELSKKYNDKIKENEKLKETKRVKSKEEKKKEKSKDNKISKEQKYKMFGEKRTYTAYNTQNKKRKNGRTCF